jgi:transaldolase
MNAKPDILAQLTDAGVSIWLDDISRERLTTGNLEGLVRDMHVRGVTSNPTIFAKALSQGSAYDDQVADLALRGVSVEEASRDITTFDIRTRSWPPRAPRPRAPRASSGRCTTSCWRDC